MDKEEGVHVHLLMLHPDNCNIFHLLWGYVGRYRDAMRYGVFPLSRQILTQNQKSISTTSSSSSRSAPRTLHVHIGLKTCMAWLELLVQHFPIPEDLPLQIHAHRIRNKDDGQDYAKQVYAQVHQTNRQNCYDFTYQMNSLLGLHFSFEDAHQSATFMHPWAENVLTNTNHKNNSTVDACTRQKPLAVFVDRACTLNTRTVMDLETGQPAFPHIVIPQVQAMGYDTELLALCGKEEEDSLLDQAAAFHRANVIVSSHGAQLTNLIYMKACDNHDTSPPNNISPYYFRPALIEIGFRFAYYQRRDPHHPLSNNGTHEAMLKQWQRRRYYYYDPRRYYEKADYFRLATGWGIRYTEVINHGLVGFENGTTNPIKVQGIVVNSTLIVQELRRLLEDPIYYDYKKHPTYNGMEGVHPYHVGKVSFLEHWGLAFLEWVVLSFSQYFPVPPSP